MPSWKLLPASSERSILPPLLIKHDVQPTSYSVYVTDLTNIWSEISDRKTIIRRALRDDTVIDPSEGPDQLKLLLDHIRDALDCHDSTSLEISADSGVQDSQGNPGLQLRVTVNLPGGLNPLLWELSLKRAQQDVFSTEFVLPMLAALANFKIQTTSLINQIKQKDSVIDKLSAKLEEAKVNLSAVFPAAGSLKGSKSSNQERLFRAAPGLKAFDEKEWQDSVGSIANLSADGVAQNVLKGGLEASSFSQISQRKWWEDLDDPIELNATSKPEQSPIGSPSQQSESQEFQRQATPQEGSTTAESDTDGLDAPPSPVPITPSKRKIGQLGKARLDPPPMEPARQASLTPPPPSQPATQVSPPKARGKIGRIGGLKGKGAAGQSQAEPSQSVELPSRGSGASQMIEEEPETKVEPQKELSVGRERETSVERADRNRLQLKKELEEKRKAPAKKKRKF